MIAQETQTIVNAAKIKAGYSPTSDEQIIIAHDRATDKYGIKYSELISPLIKAVQELYEKLNGSEARMTTLEQQNQTLQATNAAQEKEIQAMKAWICTKDSSATVCN